MSTSWWGLTHGCRLSRPAAPLSSHLPLPTVHLEPSKYIAQASVQVGRGAWGRRRTSSPVPLNHGSKQCGRRLHPRPGRRCHSLPTHRERERSSAAGDREARARQGSSVMHREQENEQRCAMAGARQEGDLGWELGARRSRQQRELRPANRGS